jgi:hypothetical protein
MREDRADFSRVPEGVVQTAARFSWSEQWLHTLRQREALDVVRPVLKSNGYAWTSFPN